jgi:hypothetical protein
MLVGPMAHHTPGCLMAYLEQVQVPELPTSDAVNMDDLLSDKQPSVKNRIGMRAASFQPTEWESFEKL